MQSSARSRWRRMARWLVGLGVAGLSFWLLVRDVDWAGVQEAIGSAEYGWVIAAGLVIVATMFTRGRRWQALLWQSPVGFRPVVTALLVGQVVNMALPMRSGDVVRAVWIGPEQRTGPVKALGSIAVEKVWDLLALLVCGVLLLAWMPLPEWFTRSTWGTGLMLVAGGGLLWAVLRWQGVLFHWAGRVLARLPAGWDEALLPRLRRLADGLESIRRPDSSAWALFWTGCTWALGALANLAVLAAFGIPSPVASLFLLAALMAGAAVPTPAGLGIFEAICVLTLNGLFELTSYERALAVGLVLHLVVMGPPLVGAAVLAFWSGRRGGSGDEPG